MKLHVRTASRPSKAVVERTTSTEATGAIPVPSMARKLLLVCGILSSLLYAAMNVFVRMLWEGYSYASQTVSELSAIGAPTRRLWFLLFR